MITLLVKQTLWRPSISNDLTPMNFEIKISLHLSSLPCVLHASCPSHPPWFHLMPASLFVSQFFYFILVNDALIYKDTLKKITWRKANVIMPTPISANDYAWSKSFSQLKFRTRAALKTMHSALQQGNSYSCVLYNSSYTALTGVYIGDLLCSLWSRDWTFI